MSFKPQDKELQSNQINIPSIATDINDISNTKKLDQTKDHLGEERKPNTFKNNNDNKNELHSGLPSNNNNININDNIVLLASQEKWFITFNRLVNSRKCLYFNIFLLIIMIAMLIYTVVAFFFANLLYFPVIIITFISVTIVLFLDLMIKIYVHGCRSYFGNRYNIFDIFLIFLGISSIVFVFFEENIEKIIGKCYFLSLSVLIMLRKIKEIAEIMEGKRNANQQNVEEIISFTTIFEENNQKKDRNIKEVGKKVENQALSFVDEDLPKFMIKTKTKQINEGGIIPSKEK
jgi:hypothetical protein